MRFEREAQAVRIVCFILGVLMAWSAITTDEPAASPQTEQATETTR
ncbi:hypothetical protein KBX71_07715 [Micromonospora sp. D93]|nr:hypothetical protein [Micromonospora sp. D93]MBQ1017756.1 hypothetical protein [Micromonospora sp. D93]